MKVSFCTTCMGRLHHLKETLPKNLEDNKDHPDVEFMILDYNSQDGLEDWVRSTLGEFLRAGRISYWKESTAQRWKMPHAKNMAHLLATGEVLCNLDADNLTGPQYASMLSDIFSSAPRSLVTHMHGGGYGGRIAMLREEFLKLRGYDEELSYGWGTEDDDLKWRATVAGLSKMELQNPGDYSIPHDDQERLKFMPEWTDLQEAHAKQYLVFEKRAGSSIVNPMSFGKGIVVNLSGETKICGVLDPA